MGNNVSEGTTVLTCPTVTKVKCTLERVPAPDVDPDLCYLAEKAEKAVLFPVITLKKAGEIEALLYQLAVSSRIQFEEIQNKYFWPYKAEVCFAIPDDQKAVPIPMLATSKEKIKLAENTPGGVKNRPHSGNIFAKPKKDDWRKRGIRCMRRPDIIIVNKKETRWPGRETTYFDNEQYSDNLQLLLEMKFFEDDLTWGQENDYTQIATAERFGVFRVEKKDEREDEDKDTKVDPIYLIPLANADKDAGSGDGSGAANDEHMPEAQQTTQVKRPLPEAPAEDDEPLEDQPEPEPEPEKLPVAAKVDVRQFPVYSFDPLPGTVKPFEDWVIPGSSVRSLHDGGAQGLTPETRGIFDSTYEWFSKVGEWFIEDVVDPAVEGVKTYVTWMAEGGKNIIRYQLEEIAAAWEIVKNGMSVAYEELKSIVAVQILQRVPTEFGMFFIVALCVDGKIVMEVMGEYLLKALLLCLVAIGAIAVGTSAAVGAAVAASVAAVMAIFTDESEQGNSEGGMV